MAESVLYPNEKPFLNAICQCEGYDNEDRTVKFPIGTLFFTDKLRLVLVKTKGLVSKRYDIIFVFNAT